MTQQLALVDVAAPPKLTVNQQRAFDYIRARDGVTADEVGAFLHAHRDRRPHGVDDRCKWCAKTGLGVLRSKGLRPLVTYRTADRGGRLYIARDPSDRIHDDTPAPVTVCPTCNGELTVNGATCTTCHGNPFYGL